MIICKTGNAIITKDNGNMIGYKPQCSCGWIDNQEHLTSILSKVTLNYTYLCSKCHKPIGSISFERS